jgi:hypothetical protein
VKSKVSSIRNGYIRPHRCHRGSVKLICPVCRQKVDQFHDDRGCAERWLRRCDEEAAREKENPR